MKYCFYCLAQDHSAATCPHKQKHALNKTKKQFIRKWSHIPSEKMMVAYDENAIVSPNLPWLTYFFLYQNIKDIFLTDVKSGILIQNKDIYSDPELVESENLLKMGQEKLQEGIYQQALVLTDLILEKDPQNYRAYITKGYIYIGISQFQQAEETFKKAIETAPSDYYKNLGQLLLARNNQCLGKIEPAIEQAKSAACPKLPQADFLSAVLYMQKGWKNDAVIILKKLIKKEPDYLLACLVEPVFLTYKENTRDFVS